MIILKQVPQMLFGAIKLIFFQKGSEKVIQWCDNGQKKRDSLDIFIYSLAYIFL